MTIVFYAEAKRQLVAIHDFISKDGHVGAVKVYNRILAEIERLALFPKIARVEEDLNGLGTEFRSLVVLRRYKVVFFTDSDMVFIVSVWDCRRNPKDFKKTMKDIIG